MKGIFCQSCPVPLGVPAVAISEGGLGISNVPKYVKGFSPFLLIIGESSCPMPLGVPAVAISEGGLGISNAPKNVKGFSPFFIDYWGAIEMII